MTEAEWLAATDPTPMLDYLRDKASDRKLRLLSVACCYRIWNCFGDERSRVAIVTAERFADSHASSPELNAARHEAERVPRWGTNTASRHTDLRPWGEWASEAASACSASDAFPPHDIPATQRDYFTTTPATAANVLASRQLGDIEQERMGRGEEGVYQGNGWSGPIWNNLRTTEYQAQALLARDIFANPFRPITFDPSWRTEAVVGLAGGMYESRDFAPMPVLADALEDAGCADADILAHCRGDGPHVRGCWVVDLVLGKS